MQRKRLNLFCLVELVFFFFIAQNVNAQTCIPEGANLEFTLANTKESECSDGIIEITLDAGSVADTKYTAIECSIEGAQNWGPNDITSGFSDGKYSIIELAPGTYTVSLIGYCNSQLTSEFEGEKVTKTIVVGGSYKPVEVATKVTKKALFDCSATGEIKFDFSYGKKPYEIEITSGPSRVGETFTIEESNTAKQITIDGLKSGEYTFQISEKCRTFPVTETVGLIEDMTLKNATFIVPKTDENSCNSAVIQSVVVDTDLHLHIPKNNTIPSDYISFRVFYSDNENGTGNVKECGFTYETVGNSYLKFLVNNIPEGYAGLRGKYLIVECTVKDETSGCDKSFSSNRSSNLLNTSVKFLEFYSSEPARKSCDDFGLIIPKTSTTTTSNITAFVCTPITYTISKEKEGESGTYVNTEYVNEEFTWARDPKSKYYSLEEGKYKISYADNSGATWVEYVTVEDTHLLNSGNVKITLDEYGRKEKLMVDCQSDEDKCHYTYARIDGLSSSAVGLTLTFLRVPSGFYYEDRINETITITEEMLNSNKSSMTLNSLWNAAGEVCRLVPGLYELRLSDPSCDQEKTLDLAFTAYETTLTDLEYEISYRCGDAYLKVDPKVALSYNGNTYTGTTTSKVLFAVQGKLGEPTLALDNKFVPADGVSEIKLPKSGSYQLVFSTQETGANVGTTNIAHYNIAIRTIDIEIIPFRFLDKETQTYICPNVNNGAIVIAKAENGLGSTTYNLYRNSTFVATVIVASGERLVYNDPAGVAGDIYTIHAKDGCNVEIEKKAIATSLEDKIHLAGQLSGCPGDDIVLKATYIPGVTYTWEFKKTLEGNYTNLNVSGNEYTISNFDLSTHAGFYRVTFNISGCGTAVVEKEVKSAPLAVVWTPENNTNADTRSSWDNENNWTPIGIPAACTDVYIPGNSTIFPELVEDGGNTCDNIFFLPGGQIGQIQHLIYNEAHVQLDLGEISKTRTKTTNAGIFAGIGETNNDLITWSDRADFGAGKSGGELTRDRWYMLSSPLQGVWTGDLAFGGYPFTYIRKFAVNKDAISGGSFLAGSWTNFYASMIEEFNPAEGFAYWVNASKDARRYHDTNDQLPRIGLDGNTTFGLGELNGILELPYFKESEISKRHRNHKYDSATNTSTFQYFWQGPVDADFFLNLVAGDTETKLRSDKSYRFIGEDDDKKMKDVLSLYLEANDDKVYLVGNPYMSALDFEQFYEDNKESIKDGYKLFTGNSFVDVEDAKIAPMQAFLVEAKTEELGDIFLRYIPANISTTNNNFGSNQLRSGSNTTSNDMTIVLSNEYGNNTTKIRQRDDAKDSFCNWDFSKIIESPLRTVLPEVYSITEWKNEPKAVSINSIKSNDLEIPLGIATAYSGNMSFEITGMDNYNAEIVFIDRQLNERINITNESSFSYNFNYKASFLEDGKTAIPQENRFAISLSPRGTAINGLTDNGSIMLKEEGNSVVIISNVANDSIESVSVFDIQGRLLSQEEGLHSNYHKTPNLLSQNGVYIVIVRTSLGYTETYKLIK